MNAALKRDPDREERTTMPSNDSYDLREHVAGLRSDVRHIQGDVTDIKAELRTTNQRIDGTNQRIDAANESLGKRIDSVNESLGTRIDELKDLINGHTVKLTASVNAAKFWAIGLLGTLLCLLGRVFSWF